LPADRREWGTAALGGLLVVAVPFTAIPWGQQFIASGLGGVLYGTMPLMTAAFAHFIIADERLNMCKLAGFALGLFGIVIVVGPSALLGFGREPLGEAVTLAAPMSYALGTVLLRRRPPMNPLRLTAGMFLIGQAIMLPVAIAEGELNHGLGDLLRPRTAVLLTGLALAGTAMPAFLNYLLIDQCVARHVLPTRVCAPAGVDDLARTRSLQRNRRADPNSLRKPGGHPAGHSLKRDLEKLSAMSWVRPVIHKALFREMSGAGHPPVPAPCAHF
jgi:hypothetical protein